MHCREHVLCAFHFKAPRKSPHVQREWNCRRMGHRQEDMAQWVAPGLESTAWTGSPSSRGASGPECLHSQVLPRSACAQTLLSLAAGAGKPGPGWTEGDLVCVSSPGKVIQVLTHGPPCHRPTLPQAHPATGPLFHRPTVSQAQAIWELVRGSTSIPGGHCQLPRSGF